jgi:chromosome segregation ATPase
MDWASPSKTADFSGSCGGGSSAAAGQSRWFANIPGKSPIRKVFVQVAGSHSPQGLLQDKSGATSPVPPVTPKRSLVLAQSQRLGATTENSERTNLLNAVNSMVAQGLNSLDPHEDESDGRLQRLEVYKAAFQHLINEFNIYKPFLSAVKNEYDTLINNFGDDFRCVSDLKVEMKMKEHEFNIKLKRKHQNFKADLAARSSQILSLEKELRKKDDEVAALKAHSDQTQQKNIKLEKDLTDLRKSCEVLTTSLTRSEEGKRLFQSNDSGRQRELQSAKMAVTKLNEELERIRNMLNDSENAQVMLVAPEVVAKHLDSIRALKAALATKDVVHKRLIDRYSTLKSAVEASFIEGNTKY